MSTDSNFVTFIRKVKQVNAAFVVLKATKSQALLSIKNIQKKRTKKLSFGEELGKNTKA
jgi:hypothetical protein